jgi:hypothetical protein
MYANIDKTISALLKQTKVRGLVRELPVAMAVEVNGRAIKS